MRSAPATDFSLPDSRLLRVLAALLVALALGSTAGWVLLKLDVAEAVAWLCAALVGTAAFSAMRPWRSRPRCRLRWDGGAWHAEVLGQMGDLVVLIDLGPWMLLRFDPVQYGGAAQWLSAGRGSLGPRWHAWRCAVYSPRPAATPDASTDEAAF